MIVHRLLATAGYATLVNAMLMEENHGGIVNIILGETNVDTSSAQSIEHPEDS